MKLSCFYTKNGEEVGLHDLNVLVGPNNAGKSQTLQDIHDFMIGGVTNTSATILEEIEFVPEPSEKFLEYVNYGYSDDHPGQIYVNGLGPELKDILNSRTGETSLKNIQQRDNIFSDLEHQAMNLILPTKIAHLDAASRLELVTETDTYTVDQEQPSNLIQMLYEREDVRIELRNAFREIFDKDILLDCSSLAKFRLKLSDGFDSSIGNIINPEDSPEGKDLHNQGAGFRGLAGVVLGILFSKDRLVLLDEPEAFLHPAQSRRFGRWVARHATDAPDQVIISTHNSHFLSGVLNTKAEVNIKRLNRSGDITKYHSIPKEATDKMSSDPLLSTQRVIDGVFHKGVIVCEGHTDNAVYSYVSNELLGEGEYLFTYAEELQTIPRISKVLFQSSIPTAVIADIDAPQNPRDLRNLLDSVCEEDPTIDAECNELNITKREQGIDWKDIKKHGIESTSGEFRDQLESIIQTCEDNGIFLVRGGELESWIDIDSSKGAGWVVTALDYLNDNGVPNELEIFIKNIHEHLDSKYSDLVEPENGY